MAVATARDARSIPIRPGLLGRRSSGRGTVYAIAFDMDIDQRAASDDGDP